MPVVSCSARCILPISDPRGADALFLVAFPLHAFLFAKLISLFNFGGQYLQDQTNFWCFMFSVLAVGVGISYFILGWSSNVVSFVSVKSRNACSY